MNMEKYALLRDMVQTSLSLGSRLRYVEDKLLRIESSREGKDLEHLLLRSKEVRYGIVRNELSRIARIDFVPEQWLGPNKAESFIEQVLGISLRDLGKAETGMSDKGFASEDVPGTPRGGNDDDWTESTRNLKINKAKKSPAKTADQGFRKLVIRKSPGSKREKSSVLGQPNLFVSFK